MQQEVKPKKVDFLGGAPPHVEKLRKKADERRTELHGYRENPPPAPPPAPSAPPRRNDTPPSTNTRSEPPRPRPLLQPKAERTNYSKQTRGASLPASEGPAHTLPQQGLETQEAGVPWTGPERRAGHGRVLPGSVLRHAGLTKTPGTESKRKVRLGWQRSEEKAVCPALPEENHHAEQQDPSQSGHRGHGLHARLFGVDAISSCPEKTGGLCLRLSLRSSWRTKQGDPSEERFS